MEVGRWETVRVICDRGIPMNDVVRLLAPRGDGEWEEVQDEGSRRWREEKWPAPGCILYTVRETMSIKNRNYDTAAEPGPAARDPSPGSSSIKSGVGVTLQVLPKLWPSRSTQEW